MKNIVIILIFMAAFLQGWIPVKADAKQSGKKSGIEGKVVDGQGKPIASVKLIANQVEPIKEYEHFETKTGSDGTFRFKGLFPTSEYILFAWGDSFEPQTMISVRSGPEGNIRLLPSDMVVRFTNPNDGVIADTMTGIQGAQDAGSQKMTWDQANEYVYNLNKDGFSDWRLPTKEEFESLLTYCESKVTADYSGKCGMYYKKIGFNNIQSDYYWSASGAFHPSYALGVNMWHGVVNSYVKDHHYYVWPVRSEQ